MGVETSPSLTAGGEGESRAGISGGGGAARAGMVAAVAAAAAALLAAAVDLFLGLCGMIAVVVKVEATEKLWGKLHLDLEKH